MVPRVGFAVTACILVQGRARFYFENRGGDQTKCITLHDHNESLRTHLSLVHPCPSVLCLHLCSGGHLADWLGGHSGGCRARTLLALGACAAAAGALGGSDSLARGLGLIAGATWQGWSSGDPQPCYSFLSLRWQRCGLPSEKRGPLLFSFVFRQNTKEARTAECVLGENLWFI